MFTIGFLTSEEPEKSVHMKYLTEKGWNVVPISNDELPTENIQTDAIIIQETNMPTTCHWLIELTKNTCSPIYLLSEEGDSHANIVYLQLGTKICFSSEIYPEELLLTLNNLLADSQPFNNALEQGYPINSASFVLLPNNLSVVIDGEREVPLTKKEFQTMEILYNNPGRAISYEEFKKKLWGNETDIEDKNYRIANTVFHLRSKIEQNTMKPRFIKTIRSKGYMFNDR
ncbi:hypothetical protein A5821_001252 [Enterococcus sp. 7F3_DIV0205]|uniref:OmpR/PhoB-type domain-containing protein n=1 Tax=Candidatus Enterococcus palustris TaxID=1834189 RepID=A0AAQ3WBC3_9ENTE|nr:winged helix-turn-helix domain-containing protein [Enterococcus sp. 7F3_DIV0205]OTN85650.1 hypothetical protein A5821_001596 [Enterococcus sp. 7F3_DIV0205]